MAYSAKDLSPEQRVAIESLLGRRVTEGEAVTIRAYKPAALSAERKDEIVDGLESYFAALDLARVPTDPHEADAVFEEAMRQTRPDYQTHR